MFLIIMTTMELFSWVLGILVQVVVTGEPAEILTENLQITGRIHVIRQVGLCQRQDPY